MPIHVRANPGDYAEPCLLPGDPLRAKYIAETFMEDVVQRNSERGMLGYTGTFGGKPVSVQSSGMGCPSAAIVVEELTQLGVTKIMHAKGGLRLLMKGEDSAGVSHQPLTGSRWLDRSRRAVDQCQSDCFFEPGELLADGRLRHMQPFRREREASCVDNGGEGTEKAWIEHIACLRGSYSRS